MASFRQECPSCGDLVLLDSKLAGKKTDCPKCKFRFTVLDPKAQDEDEDEDLDEEDGDEEDAPRKKKQGGNTPLIAGIAVGAVALLALIGGGIYFLMSGDSGGGNKTAGGSSSPTAAPGGGGAGGPPGNPTAMMPGAPGGMMPGAPGTPGGPGNEVPGGIAGAGAAPGAAGAEGAAPAAPGVNLVVEEAGPDASNLLPADSQAVFRLQLDKARASSLGSLLLQAPGTLDPAGIEATWGFGPENIKQIAVGMNLDRPWNLAVFRLEQPANAEDVAKRLNAQPQPVAGGAGNQGATVYLIPREVDASTSVFARMVNLLRSGGRPTAPLGLFQVDETNLVMGDLDRLKTYAQTDLAKLKRMAEVSPPPALIAPAEGGAPGGQGGPGVPTPGGIGKAPMGGGPPMPPVGGPEGAPMYPGMAGMGQPGMAGLPGMPSMMGGPAGPGGAAGAAPPAPPNKFLNLSKPMQEALQALDKENPGALATFYVDGRFLKNPNLSPSIEGTLKPILNTDAAILGVSVPSGAAAESFRVAVSLLDFKPDALKAAVYLGMDSQQFKSFSTQGYPWLIAGLKVAFARLGGEGDKALKVATSINQGGTGGAAAGGGMPGMGGMMGGMPGMGGMPAMGGMMGGMPGKGGGMPAMGGGPGPAGMPAMGGRPGMSGPPTGEGEGGLAAGPGAPGGLGGAAPAAAAGPSDVNGAIHGSVLASATITTIDLKGLSGPIYEFLMEAMRSSVAQARGQAESYVPYNGIHDLAKALTDFTAQAKAFPAGSLPGADRPDLRMSWLVRMIPLLPGSNLGPQVEPLLAKPSSWREPQNLALAALHIPGFVNTVDATGSSRVQWTSLGETLGASHFVGVAGVGLDTPNLPNNPANLPKLGVFGYDRATQMKEITDGPANTIAVLMVPSSTQGPWIAGGGSTVRGVPVDGNPIEPFLSPSVFNPKTKSKERGTYAIMADGKVRFLSATIPPATFMALCTMAGGESVGNIDEIAPAIGPGGELVSAAATPKPAPMAGKETAPKPSPITVAPSVNPGRYKVSTEVRRQGAAPQKKEGEWLVQKVGPFLALRDATGGKDRKTTTDLLLNLTGGKLEIIESSRNPGEDVSKQALVAEGAGFKYTATLKQAENGIPVNVDETAIITRVGDAPPAAVPAKIFLTKDLYSCEKIDNLPTLPEGITAEQVASATKMQVLAMDRGMALVAVQVGNTSDAMGKPRVFHLLALGKGEDEAVLHQFGAAGLPPFTAKQTEPGKLDLTTPQGVFTFAKPAPPPPPEGEQPPEGEKKPEGDKKPEGEPKPDDKKPAEAKPADQKPGEKKPG